MGVYDFYPQKPKFRKKLYHVLLLLILLVAIFHTGTFNRSDYGNLTFFQYLKHFYKQGRSVSAIPYTLNGGVAGGLISVPLCFVFQKTGTIIVLGTFSIIIALMITDISLKKMADTVEKVNMMKEHRNAEVELFQEDDMRPTNRYF